MKFDVSSKVSGKILWLEVRDKRGRLKRRLENIPNILLNSGISSDAVLMGAHNGHHTFVSNAESYEDLDGTWNQTGNTLTRATGTGTFPSSPSQIGNELYWYDAGANTGHRCHVTARASDTSITVSGVSKSITGGKLRRFIVNGSGISSTSGSVQTSATITTLSTTIDDTANTWVRRYRVNYNSAVSAYSLGSIIMSSCSRVKLPAPVAIDAEDQITYEYELTETVSGRSQSYELGAESVGIPQKHSMLSIVGNGTFVDVTFGAATHFLAGDKLDLRGVVTKKVAISSASSTSTTFTINTATAHSLNPGDSVTIENASLAGYNGIFTVATVVDADTFTITDAADPGAMGASGTARLTNPTGYFETLGLATIASMPSTSVARITSTITGPAVEPVPIGGDPGVEYRLQRTSTTAQFIMLASGPSSGPFTEANVKPIADITATGAQNQSGISWTMADTAPTQQNAAFGNDFTQIKYIRKNAGVGTNASRIKQFISYSGASGVWHQVTLNTPFNKETTQRLTLSFAKQLLRDLDLTGL